MCAWFLQHRIRGILSAVTRPIPASILCNDQDLSMTLASSKFSLQQAVHSHSFVPLHFFNHFSFSFFCRRDDLFFALRLLLRGKMTFFALHLILRGKLDFFEYLFQQIAMIFFFFFFLLIAGWTVCCNSALLKV